jgi:hypothetical protein
MFANLWVIKYKDGQISMLQYLILEALLFQNTQ